MNKTNKKFDAERSIKVLLKINVRGQTIKERNSECNY